MISKPKENIFLTIFYYSTFFVKMLLESFRKNSTGYKEKEPIIGPQKNACTNGNGQSTESESTGGY